MTETKNSKIIEKSPIFPSEKLIKKLLKYHRSITPKGHCIYCKNTKTTSGREQCYTCSRSKRSLIWG